MATRVALVQASFTNDFKLILLKVFLRDADDFEAFKHPRLFRRISI